MVRTVEEEGTPNSSSPLDENQRAAIKIGKDKNGISHVLLRSPRDASARVSLHGEQVRSWKIERGKEFLFTSSKVLREECLETLDYLDNLCNRERVTEQGDALTLNPGCSCSIRPRERTYVEGLSDVVVWKSWEKKTRVIPDFGDAGYKKMMCVDAAAVEKPITLKLGEEWIGRVKLCVVASI